MPIKDPDKRKEQNRKSVRAYKQRRQARVRHKDANNRANKLGQHPAWLTVDQRKAMRAIYREAVRLQVDTGRKYQVDHIWPLRGKTAWGLHVPWNIRPLPALENRQKSNKRPNEPGWSNIE